MREKQHLTTLNEIDEDGGKLDTLQYLEREVSRMEEDTKNRAHNILLKLDHSPRSIEKSPRKSRFNKMKTSVGKRRKSPEKIPPKLHVQDAGGEFESIS